MFDVLRRNGRTQLFSDGLRLLARDLVQNNGQFLAAIARRKIEWAARKTIDELCNVAQTLVAGLMTVVIVVVFEIIEIDHQHGKRRPVAQTLLPDPQQVLVERTSITQSRQSVALCKISEHTALEK